jgi:HEAT repeat protein
MRLFALKELAYLPNEPLDEFVPELTRLAQSDEAFELRFQAITVLGRMRRAGVPALRELTKSSDEYARFSATQAVAHIDGVRMSTDSLVTWLTTSKQDAVRGTCVFLLGMREAEAEKLIPILEPLQRDPGVGSTAKLAVKNLRFAVERRTNPQARGRAPSAPAPP